jgi:hypothetical protein
MSRWALAPVSIEPRAAIGSSHVRQIVEKLLEPYALASIATGLKTKA